MRRQLGKGEVRELSEAVAQFGIVLEKKDRVEETDIPERLILRDGVPVLVFREGWVPSLFVRAGALKRVRVDRGAVAFVVKGADVMRPGIVSFDASIAQGEIVLVEDAQHAKGLAVGRALMSSDQLAVEQRGKAVKNLHFVGDSVWNLGKRGA